MIKDIETSIKCFQRKLEDRKKAAAKYVIDGQFATAQTALDDCKSYSAIIDELMFQLEVLEVENDR